MSATQRWEPDTTLTFVRLYRERECLWNWKSSLYMDKSAREMAYKEIEDSMNIPGFGLAQIRRKIRTLRSTYSQELKKIRIAAKHHPERPHVPHLKWFKEMNEFLQMNSHIVARQHGSRRQNIYNALANENVDVKHEPLSDNEFVEELHEPTGQDEEEYLLSNSDHELFLPDCKRPKIETDSSEDPHALPVMPDSEYGSLGSVEVKQELKELEDEFDIFGRHVAAQLRQLGLISALKVQAKIQTLLTESRLEEL